MSAPIRFQVQVDNRPAGIRVTSPVVAVELPGPPRVIFAAVPGAKGDTGETGPAGDGAPVFGEALAGTKDGVNTVFTTASDFRADSTAVYLNGLRETHYAETGPGEITFEDAPHSGDALRIDYLIA